ncbi:MULTISPECIES: SMI1/KNR4 family protein [Bacillaceae]|uniref:SMI1/KNR4 family protein n=1 Tax=Evansella alkalicola TaxID=745819 RepID=A0ABS6JZ58_9BACI|nr:MULTISPECIES: SMI1/KNR4 family protein [Bacillaceae]MBU9723517.1 SMI1/KNR4 family protein [Bacillus alkalicola]
MHANLKWGFVKDPATDKMLGKLENYLGVTLPVAYRQLVKEYNGARPNKNKVQLVSGKEQVIKTFLNAVPTAKGGVMDVLSWLEGQLPERTVPFANDPFGNYYCFKFEGSDGEAAEEKAKAEVEGGEEAKAKAEPTVQFWDHEKQELELISNSFEGFLNKLK